MIRPDEEIVAFVTGNGYKTVEAFEGSRRAQLPRRARPRRVPRRARLTRDAPPVASRDRSAQTADSPCGQRGSFREVALEKAEFEAEARSIAASRSGRRGSRSGYSARSRSLAAARTMPICGNGSDAITQTSTSPRTGAKQNRIREMLAGAGYVDDPHVYVDSEGTRLVAEHAGIGMHIDVFLDKLEFCHTVLWKDRLELDPETIPLAELLLQKMQIVEINEKDLIDTIMLLLEFPLGDNDDETINVDRVARVCAKDWGWWRTLTMNLDKVGRWPSTTSSSPTRRRDG